ncbi:MAG: hypothetical protein RR552_00005 [Oscillospiraceae bacterium]
MKNNEDNMKNIINELSGKTTAQAEDFLMKKLNPSQSKKLNEILSNEAAAKELLSTPEAQELLKKLMGK